MIVKQYDLAESRSNQRHVNWGIRKDIVREKGSISCMVCAVNPAHGDDKMLSIISRCSSAAAERGQVRLFPSRAATFGEDLLPLFLSTSPIWCCCSTYHHMQVHVLACVWNALSAAGPASWRKRSNRNSTGPRIKSCTPTRLRVIRRSVAVSQIWWSLSGRTRSEKKNRYEKK